MALWDDNTDEKEFEKLPEGSYEAVLHETKLDMTSNPFVVTLCFRVVNNKDYKNRRLWIRLRYQETAVKFIKWQLDVLGIGDQIKDAPSFDKAAEETQDLLYPLMDKLLVRLKVSHREYNGKIYENAIIDEVLSNEFTESEVNSGVQNVAPPSFNDNEEIPF